MTPERFRRKLTAILSADVKGYSRLMGTDEEATLLTLQEHREVMAGSVELHRGRIVDTAGDSVLAEFASVVDAVQCAVEVQQVLRAKNAMLPESRRMEFRIGINVGDVIEEGEAIYGDGVNIAARLEGLAAPGGICISEGAYQQIENKLPLRYDYVGEHKVKNIARPVRVYRARIEPEAEAGRPGEKKKLVGKRLSRAALGMAALVLIAGAAVLWQMVVRPAPPRGEVASREKMALPLPDKPSIAVLPFVNISEDAEQEYFSDGITDDLITDLSKVSGLLVIARNSTFTYKGKPVRVKQVAEELGIRYVLEGSVRRAGDEVRINAQLVDALTGLHLWAERYDAKMDKVFALQDQITRKIVSALEVKLIGSERDPAIRKGTGNVAAYDEFLRGWEHYLRLTPEDLTKAASCFRRALELDPDYGRAYAALALVYRTGADHPALLRGLDITFAEARLRSGEYLQKAMRQPTPIAYNVNSQMYLWRRQHKEAILELERALSLDPNDPSCLQSMGWTLSMAGRPREAIEYINRGMRLDPHNPSAYLDLLGWAHFCMGELADAVSLSEKALKLNPENVSMGSALAAFYGLMGRDQEARAALATVRKKLAIYSLNMMMWNLPFRDRANADRLAEGLLKAGVSGQPSGYSPAFKENQLTGEQIKALLFGSTITGIVELAGSRWWVDWKKNGEFTSRGAIASDSDPGKSRIEGDMICTKCRTNWWGLEDCATVFRNPSGTPETKDEYFFVRDVGFRTFSPVR